MKKDFIYGFERLGRLRFLSCLNRRFLMIFVPVELAMLLVEMTGTQTIIITLAALVVLNIVSLEFIAQRYRDAGVSGLWSLISLNPLASPLIYILLALVPGDNDINRYGPPSQPPSLSMWLFIPALMPIILFFIYWIWFYFTWAVVTVPFLMVL
ncbi:MAG: DUF805 domain-containing protein [Oceanospirillales bacterium]|uniref:Uncharacterized membrane protein YhaH (DUF805 family) n=1 Tax=Marinobacterium halophilum TaxID=267374 RepID=A0A2P8F364_9GAMM|nr:DUF805 domain-containing protein [Marinobacterium halophilum]MBR9828996.1 DUF805 domain-containing protein [Oceanospirillales bacterium]PSL16151.1 uncharacterized membrane protein YhaH (DUF805 family) [Marinobacterium halophilum]